MPLIFGYMNKQDYAILFDKTMGLMIILGALVGSCRSEFAVQEWGNERLNIHYNTYFLLSLDRSPPPYRRVPVQCFVKDHTGPVHWRGHCLSLRRPDDATGRKPSR